jgi:glycerol-3-phosphate acyltransferase PlsX
MGGDRAPEETVAGAVAAASAGVDVVLVGDREVLTAQLAAHAADLPVVHAPEAIEMGEDPARAIREKPGSSIVTCARLVKTGEAAGFVSAGSTGAAMAAAAIVVGRLPGVLRPTIASIFPTPGTPTVVVDSGANPEVKPEHLVQFGLMGAAVSEVYFGVRAPRVGLLNNGEERGKGRALERAAYELLERAPIDFVGNLEGRDVATDRADVIVTDGFVGNVFLKTTEGAATLVARLILEAIGRAPEAAREVVLPLVLPVARRMDYEHHGGAHLLGVGGVVVIAHGSSTRMAVSNALRQAKEGAEHDLVGRVAARVAAG